MPNKGVFISFEGGEGSGKTTQIKRLSLSLAGLGYEVVETREPGGTEMAEKIRMLLIDPVNDWTAKEECLLLFAARSAHLRKIIEPALDEGKIVISDRFTDSTRAYQGYGLGLDQGHIEVVKTLSIGSIEPDLTLVLDIPVAEGLARAKDHNRYEKIDQGFHEKFRQGFLDLAAKNPERFQVIDAQQEIEAVAKDVQSNVIRFLEG